jgi:hypothetical protein
VRRQRLYGRVWHPDFRGSLISFKVTFAFKVFVSCCSRWPKPGIGQVPHRGRGTFSDARDHVDCTAGMSPVPLSFG